MSLERKCDYEAAIKIIDKAKKDKEGILDKVNLGTSLEQGHSKPSITSFVDDYLRESAQKTFNNRLLEAAVKAGFLPEGSNVESLTIDVRQKLADCYVLREAVNLGYLPNDATVDNINLDVRQKLAKAGKLVTNPFDENKCSIVYTLAYTH